MTILERLPIPRRLPPRLWLLSIPSALLTFERRQRLPRLPPGRWRLLGLPLMGAGIGLWAWSWRRPRAPLPLNARLRWRDRPGVLGGLLLLTGAALLLRSALLALYAIGLAFAVGTNLVAVEEPRPGGAAGGILGDDGEPPFDSGGGLMYAP